MGRRPPRVKRASGKCPPTLPERLGERRKENGASVRMGGLYLASGAIASGLRFPACDGYDGEAIFISASPATIRIAANMRSAPADSPKTKIPTRKAPIAPIPVQTT